ncbi:MAG: right-handed parallel beta-helix repeat-containing protein [Pseudonocardiaceae bacterium]
MFLSLVLASCAPVKAATAPGPTAPTERSAAVCDEQVAGPASAPSGAVVVDPAVDDDLDGKTAAHPPGTTFWLAPGVHTLGTKEFGQVIPKDGDTYIGAPGVVIDGRGLNRYAFTGQAVNVTIRNVTVQGFIPPQDQGVVNHDSGDGWVIEDDTIQRNKGAGLMAGARQQVRHNCLRDNGQYGMDAYKAGNAIVGLMVENNEIVGNNTDDWEAKHPGCGCTGGVKFWSVNGADVRSNWIHDNRGAGLWADTNNNDFLIENNLIEANDGEAVMYETSYNLILHGNMIRGNTLVEGKKFADRGDKFPVGTIYVSESGGEPRVPARTNKIEIYDNVLDDNWSGITAWENADRFCNSLANTSTGSCTRLVSSPAKCSQPGIATKPLYDDCRWRTQRLDVHDNIFIFTPATVGCPDGMRGRMAVLSNYGTYPQWSPYKGYVISQAITFKRENVWRNNSYRGPWEFTPFDTGRSLKAVAWQADPYKQDVGSGFSDNLAAGGC